MSSEVLKNFAFKDLADAFADRMAKTIVKRGGVGKVSISVKATGPRQAPWEVWMHIKD